MPIFVDTNVLVYAKDASEPAKQSRAEEWLARLWNERNGRLSTQVLQEYYATVTRKLDPGLGRAEARRDIRAFVSWEPLAVDHGLLQDAWRIEDRYDFSFWDALIVAAAGKLGCEVLLTEDLQDGQELDGMKIRNPFSHPPDADA